MSAMFTRGGGGGRRRTILFSVYLIFLLLIFFTSSSSSSARPNPSSPSHQPSQSQMKGIGEEEEEGCCENCFLERRDLAAAHEDYIYTQNLNP